MIAIFPGRYAGASLSWNISVPMMFPRPKVARVMAFMVLFLVWPLVLLALYAYTVAKELPNVPMRYVANRSSVLGDFYEL